MTTYPDQVRRQERADARKRRRRGPRREYGPPAAVRVAEIDRVLADRWGEVLPHDDAGLDDAHVMAHHLARRSGDPASRIGAWLDQRAPWLAPAGRQELIDRVLARPLRWKADTLAKRLGLTAADRDRLLIKTIGAIDETKEQRTERRKLKKRMDAEARRRRAGAKPRTERCARSISRTRPWIEMNISRATWYRLRRN